MMSDLEFKERTSNIPGSSQFMDKVPGFLSDVSFFPIDQISVLAIRISDPPATKVSTSYIQHV